MTRRLAIVDWGIGGLGVARELFELRHDVGFVYVSDTGAVPYGKQSREELVNRLDEVASWLARGFGVTDLAIACNAASTVVSELRGRTAVRVEGIIEHGIEEAMASEARHVGVVGGVRTIRSGVHARALRQRGLRVTSRIAQPLSALIEAGQVESEAFGAEVKRIVTPLKSCDAVLLACTHYPAAHAAFARALPEATLLDPARRFASSLLASGDFGGGASYYTSGSAEAMRLAAKRAWGLELSRVGAWV